MSEKVIDPRIFGDGTEVARHCVNEQPRLLVEDLRCYGVGRMRESRRIIGAGDAEHNGCWL